LHGIHASSRFGCKTKKDLCSIIAGALGAMHEEEEKERIDMLKKL
jgi:hypothetical protein